MSSGVNRLSRSKSQKRASGPAFSSGRKGSMQGSSLGSSDRGFGGKSGKVSISGPKPGKRGK